MKRRIEIYKDKAGEWRWRIKASNGKIVADGGEGYKNKHHAARSVVRLLRLDKSNDVAAIDVRSYYDRSYELVSGDSYDLVKVKR